MAYGTVKVDNITFDNGGSDQNVTVSGLYRATTSGVTLSGTIAAATVSGVTVIGSTTVSGATVTGTTANFTSGNFGNIISSAATMSGALIMANQQQVRFREAVGNGVNHIALQAPAIVSTDQTITLPDQTGTVITTGDNGSVSSTMLATNLTISAAAGSVSTPSIAFTGDLNTGIYSPGADQVALATAGTQRLLVTAAGNVEISTGSLTLNAFGGEGGQLNIRNTTNTNTVYSLDANTDTLARLFTVSNNTNLQIGQLGGTGGNISLFTASSERLRIDSSGNVGIGTSSPGQALEVSGDIAFSGNAGSSRTFGPALGSDTTLVLRGGSSTGEGANIELGRDEVIYIDAAQHRFRSRDGASERLRIDSSGRLLVGTSTARSNFFNSGNTALFQVEGTGETSAIRNVNDNFGATLLLGKSRSTSNTIVQNGDTVGLLSFQGNDGTEFVECANIQGFIDGTPGANDMPGRLVLSTTSDGANSPTERMRIKSTGTINFSSVATYADNTAALAGGLVAGDVYRKSDGTLMITY